MQFSVAWAATRPEDATERLAAVFRGAEIGSDDTDSFAVSTIESGDGSVTLSHRVWTASGRGRTEENTFYVIGEVDGGSVSLVAGGETLDAHRVFLIPPRDIHAAWTASLTSRTVRIQRTVVDAYARGLLGAEAPTVVFAATSPISPVHELLWRAAERHIREDVAAHPDLLHDDLIWDAAARHLVATMLAAFPNSTSGWDSRTNGERALPVSVRRAVAFMEERLGEPITLADIAGAVGLSPRGLQDVFHRVLGRSPTQELRLLRLEAARDDLVAADPASGATVTAVARRWGFGHIPRFAAAYRAQYGENPRDTLNR